MSVSKAFDAASKVEQTSSAIRGCASSVSPERRRIMSFASKQLLAFRQTKALRTYHMVNVTFQSDDMMGTRWDRTRVHEVVPGSQADRYGVRVGWMATAIDGVTIQQASMCVHSITQAKQNNASFTIRFYVPPRADDRGDEKTTDRERDVESAIRQLVKTSRSSRSDHTSSPWSSMELLVDSTLTSAIMQRDQVHSSMPTPSLVYDAERRSAHEIVRFETVGHADRPSFRHPVVHIKGFSTGLSGVTFRTSANAIIDHIVKANAKTLVWDGDDFAEDSFTSLIPSVCRRLNGNVDLVFFHYVDEFFLKRRGEMQTSWSSAFQDHATTTRPTTFRALGLMYDDAYVKARGVKPYTALGLRAIECTQSQTVYALGGGVVTSEECVRTPRGVTWHVWPIERLVNGVREACYLKTLHRTSHVRFMVDIPVAENEKTATDQEVSNFFDSPPSSRQQRPDDDATGVVFEKGRHDTASSMTHSNLFDSPPPKQQDATDTATPVVDLHSHTTASTMFASPTSNAGDDGDDVHHPTTPVVDVATSLFASSPSHATRDTTEANDLVASDLFASPPRHPDPSSALSPTATPSSPLAALARKVDDAAIRIQSLRRGHVTRRHHHKRRKSARKIQSILRGANTRRRIAQRRRSRRASRSASDVALDAAQSSARCVEKANGAVSDAMTKERTRTVVRMEAEVQAILADEAGQLSPFHTRRSPVEGETKDDREDLSPSKPTLVAFEDDDDDNSAVEKSMRRIEENESFLRDTSEIVEEDADILSSRIAMPYTPHPIAKDEDDIDGLIAEQEEQHREAEKATFDAIAAVDALEREIVASAKKETGAEREAAKRFNVDDSDDEVLRWGKEQERLKNEAMRALDDYRRRLEMMSVDLATATQRQNDLVASRNTTDATLRRQDRVQDDGVDDASESSRFEAYQREIVRLREELRRERERRRELEMKRAKNDAVVVTVPTTTSPVEDATTTPETSFVVDAVSEKLASTRPDESTSVSVVKSSIVVGAQVQLVDNNDNDDETTNVLNQSIIDDRLIEELQNKIAEKEVELAVSASIRSVTSAVQSVTGYFF